MITTTEAMRSEFMDYFQILSDSKDLLTEILNHPKIIWDENDDSLKLCICVSAMTLTRITSINHLCLQGLGKDATVLLRVMFEDLVNFLYMHEAPNLIRDFIDYDSYQKLKMSELINKDSINDMQTFEKTQTEFKVQWEQVKHRYSDPKRNWRGKPLSNICDDLELKSQYNHLYKYLSYFVHLTSFSFNEYILGRDKKGVLVEIGASTAFIEEVLVSTASICFDMLAKPIDEKYNTGFTTEITKLQNKFNTLPRPKRDN